MNGEHATTANGKGRGITTHDLLAATSNAGIPKTRASDIIQHTQEALKRGK